MEAVKPPSLRMDESQIQHAFLWRVTEYNLFVCGGYGYT
jgi:hypothetical protein